MNIREKFYLFLVLLATFILGLMVGTKNWVHFPYGDGMDYLLMSESFYQHKTPDLRERDAEHYISYLKKRSLPLYQIESLEAGTKIDRKLSRLHYLPSEVNHRYYNYHFWFYSLLNQPARAFFYHLKGDISASFLMTNLLLLLFGVWMIFHLKEVELKRKILLSLLMVFSPLFWYLDWVHTEVYSSVLVFLSLLYFFESKWYYALLFASLASIQNQALILLAFTIGVYLLYREGIKWKVLWKAFLCGLWGFLPMLFFFYHYGDYSLIDGEGYLDSSYMSWKRVWSFFFDINQGMIVGIPLVLFVLIYWLIKDITNRKLYLEYLFLIPLAFMIFAIIQTVNWNHGAAIMNRYAVWCAMILLLIFERRLRRQSERKYLVLMSLSIVSSAILIFSQRDFNKLYWSSNEINSLTSYLWNNYPSLYDPEPQIFEARVLWMDYSFTDSVKVYATKEKKIMKMQVSSSSLDQLKLRGVDPEKVDSIRTELDYVNDKAYLNLNTLQALGYDQSKDTLIDYIEKTKRWNMMKKYVRDFKKDSSYVNGLKRSGERVVSSMWQRAGRHYQDEVDKYWARKR